MKFPSTFIAASNGDSDYVSCDTLAANIILTHISMNKKAVDIGIANL